MNTTDLIGKRIGKLTVIEFDRIEHKRDSKGKNRDEGYWVCKCDCGKEVVVEGKSLRRGKIKDCEDVKRNLEKTYTQIGNEFKRENILKEGTRLDNICGKLSKANTSGVRGVSFKKDKNMYKATIGFKGETYFLGYYKDIGDAEKARKQAEEQLYKPILEKYNYKSRKVKEDEEEFE